MTSGPTLTCPCSMNLTAYALPPSAILVSQSTQSLPLSSLLAISQAPTNRRDVLTHLQFREHGSQPPPAECRNGDLILHIAHLCLLWQDAHRVQLIQQQLLVFPPHGVERVEQCEPVRQLPDGAAHLVVLYIRARVLHVVATHHSMLAMVVVRLPGDEIDLAEEPARQGWGDVRSGSWLILGGGGGEYFCSWCLSLRTIFRWPNAKEENRNYGRKGRGERELESKRTMWVG